MRKVDKKPYCVSPLSVSSKVDLKTGKMKLRPCLDLSRHVNDYLENWPCKLADLDTSAILLDKGDWQMCLDLENQYFHVRINPSHQKYLGFKLNTENNPPQYYVFTVMIYGVKVATTVVTRLIKPIVAHLHESGIRFSIYIDDGRTVASTAELTLQHHQKAVSIFEKAGWNIQMAKTST